MCQICSTYIMALEKETVNETILYCFEECGMAYPSQASKKMWLGKFKINWHPNIGRESMGPCMITHIATSELKLTNLTTRQVCSLVCWVVNGVAVSRMSQQSKVCWQPNLESPEVFSVVKIDQSILKVSHCHFIFITLAGHFGVTYTQFSFISL